MFFFGIPPFFCRGIKKNLSFAAGKMQRKTRKPQKKRGKNQLAYTTWTQVKITPYHDVYSHHLHVFLQKFLLIHSIQCTHDKNRLNKCTHHTEHMNQILCRLHSSFELKKKRRKKEVNTPLILG